MSSFKIFIKTFVITAFITLLLGSLILGILVVDTANRKARGEISYAPVYYDSKTQILTLSFFGKKSYWDMEGINGKVENIKEKIQDFF